MKKAPRRYTTKGGFAIKLDSSLCLPPDDVSEYIGNKAGEAVNTIKQLSKTDRHNKIVRVLELGVGSGIGLISALEKIDKPKNIEFYGIDIDEYSVDLTSANLQELALTHNIKLYTEIWMGDWFDEKTWNRLITKQYNVILFNPPYFPSGSKVRDKHKQIPPKTMTTDDSDGLMHYKQVMPKLHSILANESGSTIIIRRRGKADENDKNFNALKKTMATQIGNNCHLQTIKFLLPYGKFVHYITATINQQKDN